MALPDGILAGTVTFGQAVSLIGGRPTSMTFTIKPTHDLVHAATGIQILDFTETITVEEGMPGTITLPYTDQPGFRNAAGDSFTGWAYTVSGVFRGPSGQSKTFTKNFQLPMGQEVVDFDLIPGGSISLPVTAPVARVTSVLGKTGAVTAEDFADAGLGGGALPDEGVTEAKLAPDSVTQAKIAPAAVGNAELDSEAVTASKIAADAVTGVKVASGAIAKSKLASALQSELDGKLTRAAGDEVYAPADDENLLSWRRKIAERDNRVVRVVSLGNSWVAPVGASEPDKGWYSLVADVLGAGSSGRHISPRAPHSVNLSGNATYDDNANPHMVILATDGISTFFDLGDYDTIDVFYMRVGDPANPTVGRPRFSIDGGAYTDAYATDIDLFSPGSSYRLGRITNFTGDTLRLRPHATAGSGSYTFGIIARRGTLGRGVEWINWGVSGWTAARWMQVATNWPVAEPLKALPADLLHIELGANDALLGLSVASMINELRNLVTLYRGQAAPSCALLFTLMPYPDASIPDAEWDTRMDAIAALAAEFGGFVSDWRKQLGRQSQIGALVIAPTDFHLNDTGHRYVADVVARLLSPPVAASPGLSKAVADQNYVPFTASKPSGDTRVGILNWQQDSTTGYLLHLTVGANSGAANAAMAIGTDRGAATGLLISHKNSGRGFEIGVQPGAGTGMQVQGRSSAFPLRVQMFPGAGAVSLRASAGAGYADGATTAGSTTLTSATAAFVASDVGKTLTQLTSRGLSDPFGAIPTGATIASVTNATTVVMSSPAGSDATGLLFEVGSRVVPDSQVLLAVQDENSATLTTLSKDGLIVRGTTVASVPLRVNQKSGQTAPIFAVYDSSSSLLTYIGSKGHLMSGVKTAITAGDLNNSRMGWWLDDTAGAPKIKFAAKDSAGTFRTFELAAL